MWPTQEGLSRPLEAICQMFRIFCSLFLKQTTNNADTTCMCRLFYMLTALSKKKWWHRSMLHRFFCRFHWRPLATHCCRIQNVTGLIDDIPQTMLKISIISALTLLSFRVNRFNSASLSSYFRFFIPEIILVNISVYVLTTLYPWYNAVTKLQYSTHDQEVLVICTVYQISWVLYAIVRLIIANILLAFE